MTAGAIIVLASMAALAAGTPERGADEDVLCRVNGEPITLKDYGLALFWNERTLIQRDVMDFLINERLVRQEMAKKSISVKPADVDEFVSDTDRQMKAATKQSLAEILAARGTDMGVFRRTVGLTIGLCRLAGGKGRLQETQDPAIKAKMNDMLTRLVTGSKIETDPDKLEAGTAATIDGERLSIDEVSQMACAILDQETKKKTLTYLQAFVYVRQEMQRRKLELTSADLDYQLEMLCAKRAGEPGEKSVSVGDVLKSLGREPRLLRRQCDFQARAMLSRMTRAEVADEDVRKLFNADPARFGDGVPKVCHIMLRTVDAEGRPVGAEADRKIRTKIEALRARLAAGEDFSAMAGKLSEDKDTADRGGNLGFLDKSRIADPVVAAAYGLKVGEISAPVKGAAGWHLVKVLEIKRVTFDDVKAEVRAEAIAERSAQLLADLRKKARIEPGPAKL
jgi:parvulin-like peptidyl-prolyl isomerase